VVGGGVQELIAAPGEDGSSVRMRGAVGFDSNLWFDASDGLGARQRFWRMHRDDSDSSNFRLRRYVNDVSTDTPFMIEAATGVATFSEAPQIEGGMHCTANQTKSIPNASNTFFDGLVAEHDDDGWISAGEIVVPAGGTYGASISLTWNDDVSSSRIIAQIFREGNRIMNNQMNQTYAGPAMTGVAIDNYTAGNRVRFRCYQNSGVAAEATARCSVWRIR